jgi:chorismate mutase
MYDDACLEELVRSVKSRAKIGQNGAYRQGHCGVAGMTCCRGVRGATTVAANTREEILTATRQLVALMVRRNGIESKDVASALFTTTADLDAEFPAQAARQLGWIDVPLLCGHEMSIPGSLPRCIRVLVHWNTELPQSAIQHVYIRDAERLRPDLCKLPPVNWQELEDWIRQQMGEAP